MRCPLQRSLPSAILKRHYVTAKTKLPTSNRQRQFPTPCDYLHKKSPQKITSKLHSKGALRSFTSALLFRLFFSAPSPPRSYPSANSQTRVRFDCFFALSIYRAMQSPLPLKSEDINQQNPCSMRLQYLLLSIKARSCGCYFRSLVPLPTTNYFLTRTRTADGTITGRETAGA